MAQLSAAQRLSFSIFQNRGLCGSLTRSFAKGASCIYPSTASTSALLDHIKAKILMRGGPISMSEYMQDCLTSPQGGFYMNRDVFGRSGDFITSPEISQLFGEVRTARPRTGPAASSTPPLPPARKRLQLRVGSRHFSDVRTVQNMVGIWCVHTWMAMGRPRRLQLVELGPGRGTLMADLLRGTSVFRDFSSSLEVHLVEVSPALRALQWATLRCSSASNSSSGSSNSSSRHQRVGGSTEGRSGDSLSRTGMGGASAASADDDEALRYLRSGMTPLLGQASGRGAAVGADGVADVATTTTPDTSTGYSTPELGLSGLNGCQVSWHPSLDAVPDGPSPALYIAHEFFDALPVHQFVRDPKRGWLEKMVDVDVDERDEQEDEQRNDTATPSASDQTQSPGGSGSSPSGPRARPRGHISGGATYGGGDEPHGSTAGSGLRLVLSPGPTPAAALLVPRRLAGLPKEQAEATDAVEISAIGMATAERLAQRIARHGGAALLVDYGRDAPPYTDSLMAIRGHRGVGILDGPGTADLSAWVDFGALRLAAEGAVSPAAPQGPPQPPQAHTDAPLACEPGGAASAGSPAPGPIRTSGPVSQGAFLRALGIETRLQWLASRAADPAAAEALAAGCARVLGGSGEGGMGESYKVMAIHRSDLSGMAGF